jgi:carboxyl-terminal processing protease
MTSLKFMAAGMAAGLLILLVVGGAFVAGREFADDGDNGATSASSDAESGDFGVLEEIYEVLEDDFVRPDSIDRETLRQAAINGMLDVLGDPNTVYIDEEALAIGAGDSSGRYEGIGAAVTQNPNGEIVIVRAYTGSPALEAGIRDGDVILEVDGESTAGWTLAESIARVRGPKGTEVNLVVRHLDGEEESFTIVRDELEEYTVFSCPGAQVGSGPATDEDLGIDCPLTELDGATAGDVAYVRIEQFSGTAPEDVNAVLQEVREGGYSGLIVDLRNNPGGLVSATVDISDMFVDEGQIFREVSSDGEEQAFDAREGDELEGLPVVVLVNANSASGSEVFAAALQDNDRAVIIGDTTFGKGTVNILRELSDGGGLYVSIAQWFTPDGARIDGVGIAPDIEFCETDEQIDQGVDAQLQAAIDYIHGEEVVAQDCAPVATVADETSPVEATPEEPQQ